MTDNSLTIYQQFDQIQQAAIVMYKSGFFADARSEAQAVVKVMAGAELGLPPFASMTGIHIIQGKPILGANAIATLVKNDPRYDYRVKQADNEICVITWFENGKPVGESSFTIIEAQNAGLTGKETWKKYPSDMLFSRAITRGSRRYAPGVFGGAPVYTADELDVDMDESGNIIEGEIVTTHPSPAPRKQAQPQPVDLAMQADEATIFNAPASEFFDIVTALIDRYDNIHATKNAAKKLGFGAIPKAPAARVDMYRAIRDHAEARDAAEGNIDDNDYGDDAVFEG